MIDRIEELLGALAAEDEEEQEDVLVRKRGKAGSERAWTAARAGDGAIGPGDQPETEGERPGGLTALQRDNDEAEPRAGDRTAGGIMLERPGPILSELETERMETPGELWMDGPVWTVRGGPPEMDGTQRAAMAGQTAQTKEALQPVRDGELIWTGLEQAVHGGASNRLPIGAGRSGPEQAGLKGLYRQTVRGLRPAAPALPPEQAGRAARAQEPGSAASLAVDELDRAVRRDSRRYDGGMSIF